MGPRSCSVDVLDDDVYVSAGQDEQRNGVDRLGMAHSRPRQVAAKDRSSRGGEQVRAPGCQLLEVGDRFPQRDFGVS